MASEAEGITSQHLALHPDVVFLVEIPPKARLFVNSVILSNASAVFADLLGPNFIEGRDIGSGLPKEIVLPEDDPIGISDVCGLLHNNQETMRKYLAKTTDPKTLIPMVTVAEKYGCGESLSLYTRAILLTMLDRIPRNEVASLGHILSAAYVLEDALVFTDTTRRLIVDTTVSYLPLLSENKPQLLPPLILYALESRRNKARIIITHDLVNAIDRQCYSKRTVQAYMRFLCSGLHTPYWPPVFDGSLSWPLSRFVTVVENLTEFREREGDLYDDDFQGLASEIREICTGLCIHCVKGGVQDLVRQCEDESHKPQ